MPNYDYICDDCEHAFEEFQSISAKPLTECPKCSGHVHRLIGGGAGILFKGSGFYQTDYRSSNYKEAAKKDSSTPRSSVKKSKSKKNTQPKKASDA